MLYAKPCHSFFFHISIGENVDYVKLTKSPYLLLCMLLGFLLS